MVGTHFETGPESGKQTAQSRCRSAIRNPHSAFTLTELLIVITIIGILAGLLIPAVQRAIITANATAITTELQQIGGAIEDLKIEFGAYPPNGMNNGVNTLALTDFERMFKKAFPRHQEPRELILALAGGAGGGTHNVTVPQNQGGATAGGGLTGAEAVYFWLGGFSDDVAYPISGPGGPSFADGPDSGNNLTPNDEILEDRNRRYEFDLGRLLPRKDDNTFDDSENNGRYVEYDDPRNTNVRRRINLWLYAPPKSSLPMAYFDTSRHTPEEYDLPLSGITAGANIYALKQFRAGVTATSPSVSNADVRFAEDKKFQLLHCGTDDIWGEGFASFHLDVANNGATAWQRVIVAPEGPFIGDVADTLGNFMTGTLEDKQE